MLKFLFDSKELKKAAMRRLDEIETNTYATCSYLNINQKIISRWLSFHTQSFEASRQQNETVIFTFLNSLGIQIIERGIKYVIIVKKLDFVTIPISPKFIFIDGNNLEKIRSVLQEPVA